jgi:hypothetical protein
VIQLRRPRPSRRRIHTAIEPTFSNLAVRSPGFGARPSGRHRGGPATNRKFAVEVAFLNSEDGGIRFVASIVDHSGHPAELIDRWRKPPASQCHQQRRISKLPVRHVRHVAAAWCSTVSNVVDNRGKHSDHGLTRLASIQSTSVGMTQAASPSVPHMVSPDSRYLNLNSEGG